MSKHNPDHEMEVMRRGIRDLTKLSPAGRRRVLAYWGARIEALPASVDRHGEQQLDIDDVVPMMPPMHVAGGIA